jgi:predicted pyridoxine 5'-phosphate oxidase superfamily flavin-nucleotide-binding protein
MHIVINYLRPIRHARRFPSGHGVDRFSNKQARRPYPRSSFNKNVFAVTKVPYSRHNAPTAGIRSKVSAFHAGEIEVQSRLGVREDAERVGRGVGSEIPLGVRAFLREQRLAVASSLDARDRPWASLLTGPPGFVEAVDAHLLRIAAAPAPGDPLAANLSVRPELGLLLIDLRTRRRLRLNGRGLLTPDGAFLLTDAVYANCPRYIQTRRLVVESDERPREARRASSLDARTRALVAGADTFFIASWHPVGGADVSHRGGRPGFVRVADARTLEFPDYPGNNVFNTLGNLAGQAAAGLLFVDFPRGDLVQLAGRAEILWEPERAVRFSIEDVLEIRAGSPLRFELVEPWPASPPVGVTSRPVPASQGARATGPKEGR